MLSRAFAPVKKNLLRVGGVRQAWAPIRKRLLHGEYVRRREAYQVRAAAAGFRYDEDQVSRSAADRLALRGYCPKKRRLGDVHTFAFIPRSSWHSALYSDLDELGPITEYDYVAEGYNLSLFLQGDTQNRERMNHAFVEAACSTHARQPIDWIFMYASGIEVLAESLRELRERIGVPVVAMCLDDKQSWSGSRIGSQRAGMIDIAKWLDIAWTSSTVATEWYLVEGGNPLYMPEGFDQSLHRPIPLERDIEVSFVGGAYGFRPSFVQFLKDRGIPLTVVGAGWGTNNTSSDEVVRIINRSQINLGHGGIGYSEDLTNVKARDFEMPGTGGGLYVTTYNPDLAQHFAIGAEIVCYSSREEAVERIRYFLARPDEADQIAAAGRRRCLSEHRWLHRYLRVLELLAIVEPVGVQ